MRDGFVLVVLIAACNSEPKRMSPPPCETLVPAALRGFKRLEPADTSAKSLTRMQCRYVDGAITHDISVDCSYDDARAVAANLARELKTTNGTRVEGLGDGAFITKNGGLSLIEAHFAANCALAVSSVPSDASFDDVELAKSVVAAAKR